MERFTFSQLASRYCERQDSTPTALLFVLESKVIEYQPDGFFLAECQMLDSSSLGSLVILPYGPRNTFKEVPSAPFSPRGLASDMSVAVAFMPAADLPKELPADLANWKPPEQPKKAKRSRR